MRGGLKEVRQIFNAGLEFDIAKIREAISMALHSRDSATVKLSVPHVLSFSAYQGKIIDIFKAK